MRDVAAALSLNSWILPAILSWPLLGAVLVAVAGRAPAAADATSPDAPEAAVQPEDAAAADAARVRAVEARRGFLDARNLAAAVLIGEALLTVLLWLGFDPGASAWQARVDLAWIPDCSRRGRWACSSPSTCCSSTRAGRWC